MAIQQKIKTVDLNKDGVMDRVTANCRTDTGGLESCHATQVELGLTNGNFIPIYDNSTPAPLQEGTSVVYSPDYYFEMGPNVGYYKNPGYVVGTVERSRDYSGEELAKLCEQKLKDSPNEIDQCIIDAKAHPELFTWQPSYSLFGFALPQGSVLLNDGRAVKNNHLLPSSHVSKQVQNIYSPFKTANGSFKLKDNVVLDVRAKRSTDIAEYFYAFYENQISKEFLAQIIIEKWDSVLISRATFDLETLTELFQLTEEEKKLVRSMINGDDRTLEKPKDVEKDVSFNTTKKLQYIVWLLNANPFSVVENLAMDSEALRKKIIGDDKKPLTPEDYVGRLNGHSLSVRLLIANAQNTSSISANVAANSFYKQDLRLRFLAASFADKYPSEYILWASGFLHDVKDFIEENDRREGDSKRQFLATGKTVELIQAKFTEKIGNGKNISPLMQLVARGKGTEREIGYLAQLFNNRLVEFEKGSLPGADILIALAERNIQFKAGVLKALATKDDRSENVKAWVRKTISDPYLDYASRAESVKAALLLGDEGVKYVLKLTNDKDDDTRFYAYQALTKVDNPGAEVISALKRGIEDHNVIVKVACATRLIDLGVEDVAEILMSKIVGYRLMNNYMRKRRTPVNFARHDIVADVVKRSMGVDGSVALSETVDPNAEYPSLITCALLAAEKFKGPKDRVGVLEDILNDLSLRSVDRLLAAQALVAIEGEVGLKKVVNMFEKKKTPSEIIIFASFKAAELKAKDLFPQFYPHLYNPDPKVRSAVAGNLKELDKDMLLAVVLRDSRSKTVKHRILIVQALASSSDNKAYRRLKEMYTSDPDERVRAAAERALIAPQI